LARALGIPAVTSVEGILDACAPGDAIAVDGETGEVILDIEGQRRAEYIRRARHYRHALEEARRITGNSAITTDGVEISLLANVDREEDIELAVERSAAGIGLLRTEFLYLAEGGEASESRQEQFYRSASRRLTRRPVTIRILDVTPDKALAISRDIPQVGVSFVDRSIHYALAHPEVLRPQLRAILRAAADGDLRILLPGVLGATEIHAFRGFLRQITDELRNERCAVPESVPVGAMIETPAALLMVDAIAQSTDFLSIGTNDLLCHLFGRERGYGQESAYEPSLLRALDLTVRAAAAANKPLSVCGEIAGDPTFTALLIGLGIRQLSMSPERLPEVRYNVLKISAAQATALAKRAFTLQSADQVRSLLSEHSDPWHQLLSEEQRQP
jgi:phosphoenolpyruvate-protein kinase (PTS system EI component)